MGSFTGGQMIYLTTRRECLGFTKNSTINVLKEKKAATASVHAYEDFLSYLCKCNTWQPVNEDVDQLLQGVSYKVSSTMSHHFFRIWIIYSNFLFLPNIIHQHPFAMLRRHLRFVYTMLRQNTCHSTTKGPITWRVSSRLADVSPMWSKPC